MFNSLRLVEQPVNSCSNKRLKRDSNCKVKHILKSKENISRHKCRKDLKNKLKKYKLRHDGQEDPDVLDVSRILVSLLKIKSPNHKENTNILECAFKDELRPKNYLFKMGRPKQILTKTSTSRSCIVVNETDKDNIVTTKDLLKEKNDKKNRDVQSTSQIADENNINFSTTKENNKKQTNAFKLLMDSRNKSIGSNSPGKDKVVDECQSQEVVEKKNAKVKRTLLLQKMAEAKGSLKNKEIEVFQEEEIRKKMEKRATRLKSLILKYEPKPSYKESKSSKKEKETVKGQSETDSGKALKTNKLHLVDLFQEVEAKIVNKTPVPKEDKEFLKKLSPSLKKRENMLCYFKKIEKDEDVESADDDDDGNNVLIKVKISTKSKKKTKKNKLSLNKNVEVNDDSKVTHETNNLSDINHDETAEKKLLIQNKKENDGNVTNLEKKHHDIVTNKNDLEVNTLRPKRNIKRPAQYIDEVLVSSSDEELHIFTPKKKKKSLRQTDISNKINIKESKPKLSLESKKEPKVLNTTKAKNSAMMVNDEKKVAKLAPIFNTKSQLDAAAVEAKQRFLSSGVPDKLKKRIEKQKNKFVFTNTFQAVVHVQQNETKFAFRPNEVNYNTVESDDDCILQGEKKNFFEKILSHKTVHKKNAHNNVIQASTENQVEIVLQDIKKSYPKFPVYRTYRLLKDKCRGQHRDSAFLDLDNSIEVINSMIDVTVDSPDRMNWTDKYKPISSKEIIGNFETTKELKKWLITWTENDCKTKKFNNCDSDSSDFYYYSDTDSKDGMKVTNNLLILNGPVGSGKTSIVYAVASELAIKVLEVNASSKRTGKIMLQDLQEATQSHKVNRGKSGSQECSQKLQEVIQVEVLTKAKKRGRPKKLLEKSSKKLLEKSSKKLESVASQEGSSQSQVSQDSTRTCMSLILIDDADIVFEQDDGFCSAIIQLVQCSKRPVILITSSMTCPHLQRFIHTAKILKTRPLLPKMLGTWLDIMCLVENNSWCPGIGAQVLSSFRGDIRKTINYLQFYFPKDNKMICTAIQNNDYAKINVEDESSSMSWSDREVIEEKNNIVCSNFSNINSVTQYFLDERNSLNQFECPMQLFNIWWNVPNILIVPLNNLQKVKADKTEVAKTITEMEILSNVLDTISEAGCFSKHFVTDLTDSPWLNLEQNSVSEQEHTGSFSKYDITAEEISHELVTGCIVNSQTILGIDQNNYLDVPNIAVKRDRDKIMSRHNNLTDYLNSSAALDRRALALDYWSSCRSICRIEKSKTDTNTKRNNRYCHYLKSLNILCNNDSLNNLSKSLCLCKEN